MRNQGPSIRKLGLKRGDRVGGLRLLRMIAQAVLGSIACTALCGPSAAQNVEGQLVASQYGMWRVPGYAPDTYSGFAPAACRVQGGASFFPAFSMGTPIQIVDGNPNLSEVVMPSAVIDDGSTCSVTVKPAHHHQTPFYLTSATAGLQEAINANIAIPGPNTILLTNQWYQLGGSAAVIASVHGTASLGLVDVTQVPTKWYQWNGSAYVAVDTSGCNGGCVTQINGSTGPINLVPGSNVSITSTGNSITVSTSGSAGSGNVAAANQYSLGMYPNAGSAATVGGASNTLLLPTGLSTSQIDAILGGSNITVTLQAGDGHTPFSNPNNVRIVDNRTDIPTSTRSVKEWGAQCDTRVLFGATSTKSGVTTLNLSGTPLTSNDVGDLVIGVGTYAGVPAWFEDPIASVTNGSTARLSYASPFDITVAQQILVGHDDSAAFTSAIAAQLAAGGQNNISLSLPMGGCLIHHTTQTPQSLFGQSTFFTQLYGFPGEPVLELSGGESENYGTFTVNIDDQIDSTRPYNYFDATGVEHAGTVYYQPWGILTAHTNYPLAPGWFIGHGTYGTASNGVGSISSSTPTTLTVTSSAIPSVGDKIVFTNPTNSGVAPIFTTTVSAVSASTVTLAASYPGATTPEVEWFSGTSPQTIQTAIPATGRTFPMTINLANSIAPYPGGEANVAGHGAVKIDGEECLYSGVNRVGTPSITLTACAQNNTVAAAHSVGTTIVPMNAWKWDSMPWPVIPTPYSSTMTACAVDGSNDLILTATNNFYAGQTIDLHGFTQGCSFIPVGSYTVLSTGLSSSQFEVALTHASLATTPDSGNADAAAPFGAEFFPAGNVGAYGIGYPWPDGLYTVYGGGPYHAIFRDLRIQALSRFANAVSYGSNNDASFFWAAWPYSTHFDHISMYDTSCFIMATSGIDTHAYTFGGPTSDGMTTDTMNCHAGPAGAVFDLISGGQQKHNNWDSYGGGGGMGFNVSFGWDDQNGNLISEVYDAVFSNMYEETGGTSPTGEARSELDCMTCIWQDLGTATSYIGGQFQKFYGGQLTPDNLSTPIINYGAETAIFGPANGGNDVNSGNTFGSSLFINWGRNLSGCRNTGTEGCVPIGIGNTKKWSMGQTGETFATGNMTAPYVDSVDGLITAEFPGGWTFDDTAPVTHSYWPCAVRTAASGYCDWYLQYIGNGNGGGTLVPGLYDLTIAVKASSGSAQTVSFNLTASQNGTPGAPYCAAVGGSGSTFIQVNGNAATNVNVSTTWSKLDLGKVDFTNYAGCQLGVHYAQSSSSATTVETAFIDLSPVWEGPTAQKITLNQTTPADNVTCKPGTFLGSDANYIYVCTASGTVKRAALSSY
jgi:hypothetical protein